MDDLTLRYLKNPTKDNYKLLENSIRRIVDIAFRAFGEKDIDLASNKNKCITSCFDQLSTFKTHAFNYFTTIFLMEMRKIYHDSKKLGKKQGVVFALNR